ncbi:MAG TPA: DNA endonuclease SmrA [Halioglobus sp.]
MMSSDKDKEFSAAVPGVVPLKREPRIGFSGRTQGNKDSSLEHRRRSAAELLEPDRNRLTDTGIAPLDDWFVLAYKRPGVQNGVFRKLKQGRYETQSRLDLHRMTAEIARREIFEFIEESYQLGLRSVLVIHGKGASRTDRDRSSILKGCVDHWLRELEIVQAFHSAQPQHGGTGAVYVLLRKSEEK